MSKITQSPQVTREVRKQLLRKYVDNLGLDYSSLSLNERRKLEKTDAFQMLLTSTHTGFFGEPPKPITWRRIIYLKIMRTYWKIKNKIKKSFT